MRHRKERRYFKNGHGLACKCGMIRVETRCTCGTRDCVHSDCHIHGTRLEKQERAKK